MLFHSTRSQDKDKTFEQFLCTGLAMMCGLFMPEYLALVDIEYLKNLESL
jgi:Threonine synthase